MTLSQQGNFKDYDAIVIGSGISGMHSALELHRLRPKARIALLSKTRLIECNSRYAQGGIAAVSLQSDSLEQHIEDTLNAGDGLCDSNSVTSIIEHGPHAIETLLHTYGVNFNTGEDQDFELASEGGHSQRRIYHYGDETGKHIMACMSEKLANTTAIDVLENHTAINLITQNSAHQPRTLGEVVGVYVLDELSGLIHCISARVTILATGGAGKTFRYTTNSQVATGDGVAMAYRAGIAVGNMEFYQFHPTLLHHPTVNNLLISEALRGEGARLLNGDSGQTFMGHYAPKQKELATRDIVARAIFSEIEASRASFVYLDITHHSKDYLVKRFPHIYQTLENIGIDMSQSPIPVVPAAHYQCGGIRTNAQGQSDHRRLYAIGEVAFSGLHGANRLASNSLLEGVVMGTLAARTCLEEMDSPLKLQTPLEPWHSGNIQNRRRASQLHAHWRGLRGEMTSYAGIVRTEAGLYDLLQLILTRKKSIEDYYWQHKISRDFIELRNIVLNAELIVRAALSRRESRGGHFREDYPQKAQRAVESIASLDDAVLSKA